MIGVKGKAPKISNSISSILETVREKHSKKPDLARDKIVEFCGDVPRIELFARESAPGWKSIGDGVDGKDITESLNNLIEKGKVPQV